MGGQKTLRTYWRNYFEKTDALIWVVDATDRLRITDCRQELGSLLLEEVDLLAAQLIEMPYTDQRTAAHGGKSTRLRQQDRCEWVYD